MVQHWELKKRADENKRLAEENYKANSKTRLTHSIETKIRTTMIGALDKFEKKLGFLWDPQSNDEIPSANELAELWQEVRTEILDNGNNQIRAIKEEVGLYDVKFNKYVTEFLITKPEEKYSKKNPGNWN
jgi:hypothetical protein